MYRYSQISQYFTKKCHKQSKMKYITRRAEQDMLEKVLRMPEDPALRTESLSVLRAFIRFNMKDWTKTPGDLTDFVALLKSMHVVNRHGYWQLHIMETDSGAYSIKPYYGGVKRF